MDFCDSEDSLIYKMSYKTARDVRQRNSVSKHQKKKKRKERKK